MQMQMQKGRLRWRFLHAGEPGEKLQKRDKSTCDCELSRKHLWEKDEMEDWLNLEQREPETSCV